MWDHPGPGIKPASPALAGGFFPSQPPGKLNSDSGDLATPHLLSAQFPGGHNTPWKVDGVIYCGNMPSIVRSPTAGVNNQGQGYHRNILDGSSIQV